MSDSSNVGRVQQKVGGRSNRCPWWGFVDREADEVHMDDERGVSADVA